MKRLGKFIIFACLISFITPKTSRMKRCRIHILFVLLICLSCPALLYAATEHAVSIEKLKVEYAEMPLGIDVEKAPLQLADGNAEYRKGVFAESLSDNGD